MRQAPPWLPYRIRTHVDQARIHMVLKGLDRTRPYPATSHQESGAELHMLLCRRDLKMGVLALKSLLRFAKAKLAVTLTDDGTLRAPDRHWVDRHIPNCRWLGWPSPQPELEAALEGRPLMGAIYRNGTFPLICKVLHPIVLSRSHRVILLDPDTAFFAQPDLLLDWTLGHTDHPWYMHDHQDETIAVPPEAHEAFADLTDKISPVDKQWRMKRLLFNSGLLAFRPADLDLDLAEAYLKWRQMAPDQLKTGKSSIWFGNWTLEQTSYLVMYAFADPPAQPLGGDYLLGASPGHVFNHFLRHYLVRQSTLQMLKQLINEL